MNIYNATNKKLQVKSYMTYFSCIDDLRQQGCRDLGWLNSGITLPDLEFEELFCNSSGSSCVYINKENKLYYSVDMGD